MMGKFNRDMQEFIVVMFAIAAIGLMFYGVSTHAELHDRIQMTPECVCVQKQEPK